MSKADLSFKSIMRRIAVLFIYLLNAEVSLINTALGEISKAFPGVDPVLISLVSTWPVLIMVFMNLFVVPQLAKKHNKKSLVIFGIACYAFGGVGGALVNNTIYHLLAMRTFVGIGAGICAPMCGAIINELYDGLERNTMMGWANGVDSLVGIGLTMVAGMLCAISWKYTFLAYGFFIITLIMTIIFLPSIPAPAATTSAGEKVKLSYNGKQKLKLFFICLYALVFLMCIFATMLNTAIFIMDKNLGSPVVIATVMSCLTAGIVTGSLLYGFLDKLTKRYTMIVSSICVAVGAFLMYSASVMGMVFVSGFFIGVGAGLNLPLMQTKALAIGHKSDGTFAVAMVLGVVNGGQFLASFTTKFIALFAEPTAANCILFTGISFIVITIISLIYIIWDPFKGVNYNPDTEEVLVKEVIT